MGFLFVKLTVGECCYDNYFRTAKKIKIVVQTQTRFVAYPVEKKKKKAFKKQI